MVTLLRAGCTGESVARGFNGLPRRSGALSLHAFRRRNHKCVTLRTGSQRSWSRSVHLEEQTRAGCGWMDADPERRVPLRRGLPAAWGGRSEGGLGCEKPKGRVNCMLHRPT